MRHQIRGRKFGRDKSHRAAMLMNLAKTLIEHEQIKTTLPKAKDLRPYVEKLLTLGRRGDLHARRQLLAVFGDETITAKVMGPLATRYASRPGGYTRIVKAGFRHGDNAPVAVIELIDRDVAAKGAAQRALREAASSTDGAAEAGATS